jgi:integrase
MKLNKLTARQVSLAKSGTHGDGGGLYFRVRGESRAWVFRFHRDGKPTEMGLGSYPAISLSLARVLAANARTVVVTGGNPIAERKEGRRLAPPKPTFGKCAIELIASKMPAWRNEKHRQQWRTTLETHAAALWSMPVDQVDLAAVLGVLQPMWLEIPETAARLRGRIEAVLDAAKVQGLRTGENPAAWRGNLASLLAARHKLSRGHHAAMAYEEVPAFVASLQDGPELALRFLILSACRVGEVLGATWDEMDLAAKVWTIPAARMKAGTEHRVPITGPMMEILEGVDRFCPRVFPVSHTSLAKTLTKIVPEGATMHGFRSSFRDWADNETNFHREIAEGCLAHASGDATERAYRHSDALERRRELISAWGRYCTEIRAANVVSVVSIDKILSART